MHQPTHGLKDFCYFRGLQARFFFMQPAGRTDVLFGPLRSREGAFTSTFVQECPRTGYSASQIGRPTPYDCSTNSRFVIVQHKHRCKCLNSIFA